MTRAILVLLFAGAVHAQMPPELDSYIEKARADWDIPGIAVTIVQDGKLLAAKGYGVRRLGSPERVDERTLFDIASISKTFTGVAAATVVDEGKLRWDDPVRRWLPQVEFGDACRTHSVTVRDLLSHRSGLEPANFLFRFTQYSRDEIFRRMRHLEEQQPFRGGMVYNNIAFSAGGEAAAAAAGMSWTDLVRTRLIEPLGMRDTAVGVEHTGGANFASPHAIIGGVHQPIRNRKAMEILPANGVNSNAQDMAKWLLFQMGDGTWEGKRIVSPEAFAETHSPQTIIPTTPQMRAARGVEFFAAYGIGIQVMDFHGRKMLWHSGSADGMPVYMAILPKEKLGVVVMTNSWAAGTLHGALASRIFEVLLGEKEPRDWAGETLAGERRAIQRAEEEWKATQKARVPDTKPSKPLEAYAGTYVDALHGDMNVALENGKLVFRFAGDETADLEHWHHDVFRATWRDRTYEFFDTFVAFALDAAGNPKRIELRLNRDVIEATRR